MVVTLLREIRPTSGDPPQPRFTTSLVVATPRPAEQESVTFSRRIHVRTDDVALTVNSPGNGRRGARIFEGNEVERAGQAGLRIGPKRGDRIAEVQHETAKGLRSIHINTQHLAGGAHVGNLSADAERKIEGREYVSARKEGAGDAVHHVVILACDDAAVCDAAIIHRGLLALFAKFAVAYRNPVHGPHRVGVMVAAEDLAAIRN